MESVTEKAKFRVRCNIFVEGIPEIEFAHGPSWFSLDLGRSSIFFDSKAHFKAFVKKLTEEAEKV